MAAEPKPPTSPFWQFFKRGKVTTPEATLTATAQIDPAEEFAAYRTDQQGDDMSSYIKEMTGPNAIKQKIDNHPPSPSSQQQWTTVDYRNVAIASVVPIGISVYNMATLAQDENVKTLFEEKPLMLPPAICATLNLGTIAPLGLASYLVWNASEESFKTMALGLYAATMGNLLAVVPAFKSQNTKMITGQRVMLAAFATATACAFYKTDNLAGKLTIPFAAWSAYQALPWLLSLSSCCSSSKGTRKAGGGSATTVETATVKSPIRKPDN